VTLVLGATFATMTSAGAASYQLNGLGAGCTEPGSSNTVHGNGFTAGSSVDVILGNTVLRSLVADDSGFGAVDGSFTVPSSFPNGSTTVRLEGPSSSGTRTLTFPLQVGNCAAPTPGGGAVSISGGAAGGGGALAFTGGNTGLIVGVSAALLLLGGTLFVSSRRRRDAQHPS
jgi:hypothetical protein